MKKIILSILLILASFVSFSQIMSLHLLKYEKTINPLFSKKSKSILITFDKNSLIDSPNIFNFLFKVDISDRKSEVTGIVNDLSIGGAVNAINRYGVLGSVLASSFNTSKQFSFRNTNGFVVLEKSSFDSLILFSEKLINIMDVITPPQNLSKSYFYKVDKLEISLEVEQNIENVYTGNDESSKYKLNKTIFLKIDESVYVFSESEFRELYNSILLPTKNLWNNK